MHCTAAGRGLAQDLDDRVRMADAGNAPGADQTFPHEALKRRADIAAEQRKAA